MVCPQLSVNIKIADIPQPVLDDAGARLLDSLVPVIGVAGRERAPEPLGSGTLVKIYDNYYILTAAHVWYAIEQFKGIGFALTSYSLAFTISREYIREYILPRELPNQKEPECEKWGPDLALLRLPPNEVPKFKAHKSFVNLVQQKAEFTEHPPNYNSVWAVTGMVGEFSHVESRREDESFEVKLKGRAFFSGNDQAYDRDGYDYLELSSKSNLQGVPSSYGGVSGGGLWQVDLKKDASGVISWDGRRHFRGVAFWQSPINDGRRMIRCHGPNSLFEKAWKEWELG